MTDSSTGRGALLTGPEIPHEGSVSSSSYGVGVPPLAFRVSPTTKLDSGEARNTKTGAISAGWAGRPSGVFSPNSGSLSGGWPPAVCSGVQTGPGATTLTRMPFGASCWARALEKVLIAALVLA